jgi:hypothetical protein
MQVVRIIVERRHGWTHYVHRVVQPVFADNLVDGRSPARGPRSTRQASPRSRGRGCRA